MPADIDALSLAITTSAGPAAAAVRKLARNLTELGTVLNAIDTTKLGGTFLQLAETLRESGITVRYAARQTRSAAQETNSATSAMSKNLHTASHSMIDARTATEAYNWALAEQADKGQDASLATEQIIRAYKRMERASAALQTATQALQQEQTAQGTEQVSLQQEAEQAMSRYVQAATAAQAANEKLASISAMSDYVRSATAAQEANDRFAGSIQQVEALFRDLPYIIKNVNHQLGVVTEQVSRVSNINVGKGLMSGLTSFVQGSGTFSRIQQTIAPIVSSISQGMEAAGMATEGFTSAVTTASTAVAGVGIAIKAAAEALKFFLKLVKTGYQIVRKFVSVIKSIKKFFEDKLGITELKSLLNSILSMLKRQLIRRAINNALSAIEDGFSSGIENLEKYDERFGAVMANYRNAMGLFKNSVAVAFAPIIAYAIPHLVKLLNTLTWVCNQIARLTALLTGQHTYTIAKSYEEIADAASSAGNAAKEAQKTILGFDEINQLNGNKGSGSGGGSGAGDALSGYETVEVGDWPYSSWGEAFSAFLDWLNHDIVPSLDTTLQNVGEKLNNFAFNLFEMLNFEGVQDKISELGSGIGTALNKFFNEKLDWVMWGKAIGLAIESALNFASNLVGTFDFVALGSHLADFLGNASRQIKPNHLADVLVLPITTAISLVGGFLSNPEVVEIARFGGQVANSMVDAIRDAWEDVPWKEVKDNVLKAIDVFFTTFDVDDFLSTVDEITNDLYDIVSSAITKLVNNPKFIKLVTGVMFRLASLAARVYLDTFLWWIPDSIMTFLMGEASNYGSTDMGVNESDLYGLYDPLLAGAENTKRSMEDFYASLVEQNAQATSGIAQDTRKAFTASAQDVNKTFGQIAATVRDQSAQARAAYSRELTQMGVDTTTHMRSMANQCSKYSADANTAITNNLTSAKNNANKAASDLQVGVSNSFKSLSSSANTGVSGLSKAVTDGLNLAKNNAVKAATDTQKSVTNAFNSMYGGAKGGMNNLIYGAEKMANGIIDANNTIIKSFDSMSIGGKKVASSSGYVSKVSIPRLATGGIISSPTQAILGERGAEAVMPLERNTGWIDRLANTIAESVTQTAPVSQGGDTYVMLDGKVIAKAVNRINQRDNRRYSPVG